MPAAGSRSAAVDVEGDAGYEPGHVPGQVDGGGCNVVDVADRLEGNMSGRAFEGPDAGRGDDVGGDAVDPDPGRAQLEGEGLRQAHHGRLLGGVDGEAGGGPVGLDRGEVDDRGAGGGHQRHEGPHAVGHAVEVLEHQGVLALEAHTQELAPERAAHVVDQDVHAAEALP